MSKTYGYARCSLAEEKGQDLNRQTRELATAGAEEIITEREHGDAKSKPNLDFLLDHMETGSTLIVCEVSRLSRSVLQFCEIMETVKTKHLRLIVLGSITVDCRNGEMDPMSAAFLQMASISIDKKRSWYEQLEGGMPVCRFLEQLHADRIDPRLIDALTEILTD